MLEHNADPASLLDGDNLVEKIGATTEQAEVDFDDLPKILWLRGDEPYFEAYDLDADQTMVLLGIKRSRLNQISGKELRVARKRDGRYIRPFYRKEEVEEYLNWTRATVSHKRSSEVVDTAAKQLSDKADSLKQEFSDLKTSIESRIEETVHTSFESLQGVLAQAKLTSGLFEKAQKRFSQNLKLELSHRLSQFELNLNELVKTQDINRLLLEQLTQGTADLLSRVQLQTEYIKENSKGMRLLEQRPAQMRLHPEDRKLLESMQVRVDPASDEKPSHPRNNSRLRKYEKRH